MRLRLQTIFHGAAPRILREAAGDKCASLRDHWSHSVRCGRKATLRVSGRRARRSTDCRCKRPASSGGSWMRSLASIDLIQEDKGVDHK